MRFHGQRGGRTRLIPGVPLFIGMREIKDDRVVKETNEIRNRGPYTMSNVFQHMNCIVVFSREKDSVLFCRRKKEPYAGLFILGF